MIEKGDEVIFYNAEERQISNKWISMSGLELSTIQAVELLDPSSMSEGARYAEIRRGRDILSFERGPAGWSQAGSWSRPSAKAKA